MERTPWLWTERGGREMTKWKSKNSSARHWKEKFLSNLEIGEIVKTGITKDDVEPLNERSDEVDSDLEVAIKEQ